MAAEAPSASLQSTQGALGHQRRQRAVLHVPDLGGLNAKLMLGLDRAASQTVTPTRGWPREAAPALVVAVTCQGRSLRIVMFGAPSPTATRGPSRGHRSSIPWEIPHTRPRAQAPDRLSASSAVRPSGCLAQALSQRRRCSSGPHALTVPERQWLLPRDSCGLRRHLEIDDFAGFKRIGAHVRDPVVLAHLSHLDDVLLACQTAR